MPFGTEPNKPEAPCSGAARAERYADFICMYLSYVPMFSMRVFDVCAACADVLYKPRVLYN